MKSGISYLTHQERELFTIMPDVIFTQKEAEYLTSQRLARIATASSTEGIIQPDVVPVGFDFDGEYFYVSGMNLVKSTKYKNVQKNPRVSLVVDDLKSLNPWEPRGIRIYGIADIVTRQDGYMQQTDHPSITYIRIKPLKKWSWGIEAPAFQRSTVV
jgi:pyridoxamine 5'-phosphate oxidase family protein